MNLTKKQQIQVSLIIVCFIIFFWQLYKLFSTPEVELPPAVPQTMAPKADGLAYPTPTKAPLEPKADASVAALEGPGAEYTRLSNELQIVQMQRAIAESYEAIAVAKRNTAKALAETSQIMGNNAVPGSITMESSHSGEYELIYTGQEGGQWTATLKKNNQTFDIVPNTVLGNMKVLSIDDNGVTVVQGDKRKIITFNGIVPVSEPTLEAAASVPKAMLKVVPGIPAAPIIADRIEPVAKVKPEPQKLTGAKQGISSLASLNPAHYTIQIMADSKDVTLTKFVKEHRLGDKALIVKTNRNGKDWYILLYGTYPSLVTANAAINKFDNSLLECNPFARKIGAIQANTAK